MAQSDFTERRLSILGAVGLVAISMLLRRMLRNGIENKKRMRLVHYNVNRLRQLERVGATLEALKPDAVTLNEIDLNSPGNGLSTLALRLGLESIHFYGHARNGSYGNAILCRQGSTVLEKQLDGGTRLTLPSGVTHHIVRGLLVVRLDDSIHLAVTHLDHISENERLVQTTDVLKSLEKYEHLLLAADLNALRRDDYQSDQLQRNNNIDPWLLLEQRNQEKGWTPPIDSSAPGGALYLLQKKGYLDLALLAAQNQPSGPNMTASSHCPKPGLCQRIDYAFASPKLAINILTAASFVDTQASGSDHAPLVVDLTFRGR